MINMVIIRLVRFVAICLLPYDSLAGNGSFDMFRLLTNILAYILNETDPDVYYKVLL